MSEQEKKVMCYEVSAQDGAKKRIYFIIAPTDSCAIQFVADNSCGDLNYIKRVEREMYVLDYRDDTCEFIDCSHVVINRTRKGN